MHAFVETLHLFEDSMSYFAKIGDKWEDFIKKYLPELIDFRFMFSYEDRFIYSKNMEELLEPYRTNFWLCDRRLVRSL